MTCEEFLGIADEFIAGDLPAGTLAEAAVHVDGCGTCRAVVEARHALRGRVRDAFDAAPLLQADDLFLARMRASTTARARVQAGAGRAIPRWMALAATVLLAAGLGGAYVGYSRWADRVSPALAAMAAGAAGDHRNCALHFALAEKPVSLADAARDYDPGFARIRAEVEASPAVKDGTMKILDAHSCVYRGQRFAHVVLQRRNDVVSLLVAVRQAPVTGPARLTACTEHRRALGCVWRRREVPNCSSCRGSTRGRTWRSRAASGRAFRRISPASDTHFGVGRATCGNTSHPLLDSSDVRTRLERRVSMSTTRTTRGCRSDLRIDWHEGRGWRAVAGGNLAAVAVAGAMTVFVPVQASAQASSPTAMVYVETNAPDGNAVLAYERNDRGRLTLLGSYPTGGRGVFDLTLQLGPFDSDQEVITNPEHTRLFAVNSGSNSIAVFDIAPGGQLTRVPGSPFPSGGSNPVSVGLARDVLTVVNKGMDPAQPPGGANYTSFRVTPEGRLTSLLSSTPIDAAVSASQALISPGKRLLFGADFLGGLLRSFLIQPDGDLQQTGLISPPASEANGDTLALPLGLAAHPKAPVVYVGFVTVNRIGVYTYDPRGVLTFVKSVADSGKGACWIRANDTGTRIYVANTGDNSISVFDTTSPLDPVEIQRLPLASDGNAFQLDLDPNGQYLYVVTQRASDATPLGSGNNLNVLDVGGAGRLSQRARSVYTLPVLPDGVRPQGVAAVIVR